MSIAEILPQGEYSLVHVRSRAFQTKPLAMSAHHPKTLKAKHFFLLVESSSRCPVLALEIYVYLTFENDSLKQHIFVPKADTSGLGDRRINVAAVVQVLLDRIIQTNPGSYLSEPVAWRKDETEKEKTQTSSPYPTVNILQTIAAKLKADPTALEKLPYYGKAHHTTAPDTAPPAATATTKVSLFTRSANAYIFPNSELNSGKHPPPGTPVSHKQYKKIVDFVKGEDYNAKTDIQAMTESGLPEVFSQCGVEYEPLKIAQVNTLTARKRPAVNNLTGLVRKAPKAP
ncbi:hypothetical protein CXQ85_001062 [Candidozyma haemuli]|uniref:histone acetyltransferase n=1 Tax=Candidozyma haemuli TaxID=45357 RepID=A0A2V1ANH2_9ASCO|nr:hypothetical protein CXQ85_001062 [[Candida] haemuloni]PVH18773.1 hypothetical protein CXQ85_001062 [[Candida] haemuloni]